MKFRDFHNMEIPQWALDAGFEDQSSSEDLYGRLSWQQSPGVCLWVDAERPEDRVNPENPRYVLFVEVQPIGNANWDTLEFVETDDPADVLALCGGKTNSSPCSPGLNKVRLEFTLARAKSEIATFLASYPPAREARSFADLFDYCDAGQFGNGWQSDEDYWAEVWDQLNLWLTQVMDEPVPPQSPRT